MKRGLVLLLALAACGGPARNPSTDHRTADDQRKYDEAVARGEVRLGMTMREVERARGRPQRIDRTKYKGREVTRWNYPTHEIYFHRDGFVIGWAGY